MNNNRNITHRTQAIIGFRAANRNAYGVSSFGNHFDTTNVQNDEEDTHYFGTSSRKQSNHSDETILTDERYQNSHSKYYDESSIDETIDGNSDSCKYPIQSDSFDESSIYVSKSDLERFRHESSNSWRTISLYSSRRGSASVVGSLKTRSLANKRARRCFDILFIIFGLLTLGFVAFGFVFQDDIRKSPIVESLVGKKVDEEEQQQPSQTPSQSPDTVQEPNISTIFPSQVPTVTSAPTSVETVSRSFNSLSSYPSHLPHGTSMKPSVSNDKATITAMPSSASSPSKYPISSSSVSSIPSYVPHTDSTKAPVRTPSPFVSVVPSQVLTPLNSVSPTFLPSISPTIKACNSSSYEDRKSRYEDILKRYFYDPSTSDGSKYNALMNWIARNTFLDVCNTVEQLLLERMVWASVYFAIHANYTNADGNAARTLKNYLTDGPHCNRSDDRVAYFAREWAIKCDDDGLITEIEIFGLDDRNEGEFPVEIVHLIKLQKIIITNSPKVTGTIPNDLFTLSDLEYIDFTNLGLSGLLFPPSFFASNNQDPPSKRLKVLKLGSDASLLYVWYDIDKNLMKEPSTNDLFHDWFANNTMNNYDSSIFPSEEILSFERLEILHIENANLIGNLPNLNEMVTLKSVSLWGNRLTGQIPTFPQGIEVIRLKKNLLNGTIPNAMGQYTNLTALELGNNPLGGTIPSILGNLQKLNSLHLYDNNLEGTIPNSISSLLNLETLFLQDNHLSGSIPTLESRESTVDLWIDLSNNNLVGTLPFFSQSLKLRMFKASQNRLQGSIPPSILQSQIWYIHLDGNLLNGTIPSSEQDVTFLKELVLHDNELTGQTIPLNGGYMARMQTYHDNYIRGVLDPLICDSLNELQMEYRLTADCIKYVECQCCTECYNGKIVTTSPSLSPMPSQRPSVTPTMTTRPSIRACPTPPPGKGSKSPSC